MMKESGDNLVVNVEFVRLITIIKNKLSSEIQCKISNMNEIYFDDRCYKEGFLSNVKPIWSWEQKIICFYSAAFTNFECRYSASELELFTAVKNSNLPNLIVANFTLRSGHKGLIYLYRMKKWKQNWQGSLFFFRIFLLMSNI